MSPQEIHDNLKAKFGGAIPEAKLDAPQPWVRVERDKLEQVAYFLRDEPSLQFNYLSCLSGVDHNDGRLGVVYHLCSTTLKHTIVLKALCSKENPHVQTVSAVWGTANWHEREAFDMIGIIFDGHPDLRRILCPDDWEGYPLRKDYKVPEFYNGMRVPY